MSTTSSVSVGLQSCILMHKLDSSKPTICREEVSESKGNENKECINGDLGGWSFIQALANPSQTRNRMAAEEEVYVHPLVKRSASTLSTKSLEMCTESLGSETGSDISETIDEFSSLLSEKENFPAAAVSEKYKNRESFSKKLNRTGSFPPPLTSISGSDGVQVRSHREGGRLVITTVAVTLCSSLFQAERSDGRLRLSLRKAEYEVLENEEEKEDQDEVGSQADIDDDDDEEEEEAEAGGGQNDDAGDEVVPIARPACRCKESQGRSKELQSWAGPYCVAIS